MSKLTDTEIDAAIASLTAKGLRVTTLNLRSELKTGSYSSLQKILRERGFLEKNTTSALEAPTSAKASINELLDTARQDLATLQKKERVLKLQLKISKDEITKPLAEANAVMDHYLKRIIQDNLAPEIPQDLIRLLELFMQQDKPLLLHNDNSYFTQNAQKLIRLLCLAKELPVK